MGRILWGAGNSPKQLGQSRGWCDRALIGAGWACVAGAVALVVHTLATYPM